MSFVTEVLVFGAGEQDVAALNTWLEANDERRQQLVLVTPFLKEKAGGTKLFCESLWAAAFNYVPEGLLALLRDPASWHLPCAVVIGHEEEPYVEALAFDWLDDSERIVRR